jgi:hypothetical protein
VYEPFLLFGSDGAPEQPSPGPDIAVTGEEYVLLSLIEMILSFRHGQESMRCAFSRARASGALDDIPGLIYPVGRRVETDGVPEELVDTGVQRLLGDLDELPHPVLGYRLLEPPGHSKELAPRALEPGRVRCHSPISSLVMTFGCKFACPYCPIPAYNQRQHRVKSPARIADEMWRLNKEYGLRYFFGTDDNFFNTKARTLDIVETLARAQFDGVPLRKRARWYTEVTVHGHAADEGSPPARAPGWVPRAVARRGGHDCDPRQQRSERRQDDRVVPAAARRRHLPDADDDAPRHAAARLARQQLRLNQPGPAVA